MTRLNEDNDLIIEQTPASICELCGAQEELRPYGPNNENICFDCGQKDPATTARKFNEMLAQASKIILGEI